MGVSTGVAVTFVGVYGYSALARANLRNTPDWPWAPLVALPLLWLYWRYLGGAGWPRSTSDYRKRMRRANLIPRSAWGLTAATVAVGGVFVAAAMMLGFRLSNLPADALRMRPRDLDPPWRLGTDLEF